MEKEIILLDVIERSRPFYWNNKIEDLINKLTIYGEVKALLVPVAYY